jgi:hypothetical protein
MEQGKINVKAWGRDCLSMAMNVKIKARGENGF